MTKAPRSAIYSNEVAGFGKRKRPAHRHVPLARRRTTTYTYHTAGKRMKRKSFGKGKLTTRNPGVTKKGMKKVSFHKKGANPKITKKFKAKIYKALEMKAPTGYYQDTSYGLINFTSLGVGEQVVNVLSDGMQDGLWFNPMRILDAASILFNGKGAGATGKWTPGQNAPASPTNNTGGYSLPTGSFDPANIKIHCINSYVKYEFRNNSQRTVTMKLFECKPKSKQDYYATGDALGQWSNTMQEERQSFSNITTHENVSDTPYNRLHVNPTISTSWKNNWSAGVTNVRLEPGQTYTYYLKGPQHYDYDFEKFWATAGGSNVLNYSFQDIQPKCTRSLFVISYPEVLPNNTNPPSNAARYAGLTSFARVTYECTYGYVMSMPEQAGFSYGNATYAAALNKPQPLGFRRHAYAVYNWAVAGTATTRIDDEQPGTGEANP
nr:MAG: capsid protein [Cressdnaviricota sp.]